jgi:hypothetical protein
MTEENVTNNESEVDENVKTWVYIASFISIVGATYSVFTVVIPAGFTMGGRIALSYTLLLVGIAIALPMFKKWAYWAFLAVMTFNIIDIITDLMLVAVDMSPYRPVGIPLFINFAISIAWVTYFLKAPVRVAFGAKKLW